MSLLGKVAKFAGKVVKKVAPFIPGPIGTIAKGVAAVGAIGATARPFIGSVGRGMKALPALPGVGTVVKIGRQAGKIAGGVATGAIIYDAFGNPMGRRKAYRRINPLNHKALNRALKRVCKAKGLADRLNAIDIKTKSKRKTYAC